MLFYHKRLKKAENVAKNSHFKYKKRLDTLFTLYQTYSFLMCEITYFNTICVHPSKSAHSLLKMRTAENDYVFNVSSSSRLAFIAAYVFFVCSEK